MNENITTNKLEEFGIKGRNILIKLLQAWRDQGLPYDFCEEKVIALMNKKSKKVFLINNEYQVAMLNGEKLELLYSCKNCHHEGFQEICKFNDEGCNECLIVKN
jgi:hypothetical protein